MTIRNVRLPLVFLVDTIWNYAALALVIAFAGQGGTAPSFIVIAAAIVGSYALERALQETVLSEAQLRGVGVAASVVAIFVLVHLEYAATTPPWDLAWLRTVVTQGDGVRDDVVVATVGLTLIWMRGIARGRESLSFDSVARSAAVGVIPVAIAAGYSSSLGGPNVFGPLAIAYLLLAIGALALYQVPDPDRPLRSYAAQWGAGAVVLLLAAAMLTVVAAAIDPGALGVLAPIGRPLALLAKGALYIVGPPLAGLAWILSWIPLPHVRQHELPQMPNNAPSGKEAEHNDTPAWAHVFGRIVAAGSISLLIAIALFGLWLLFRRFAKPREESRDRRERVEAESSLADDLGALFNSLTGRFRRGTATRRTIAVRRLYYEMLERGAAAGLERPPSATPLQFAPYLDAHYASDVPSAITSAFVESRYGDREFEADVVDALRLRWKHVDARIP